MAELPSPLTQEAAEPPGDNPNCAWVRAKVGERGWAQEIEALASAALATEMEAAV